MNQFVRGIYTQQILEKRGINAFFSSCLTTTLDIDFAVDHSEWKNEIIFIDYKFGRFPLADKYINFLLPIKMGESKLFPSQKYKD